MNNKPDWIMRGLLVLIAVLLVINIGVSLTTQTGRYMRFTSDDLMLLDTRTGKIYLLDCKGEQRPCPWIVVDVVERAKIKK